MIIFYSGIEFQLLMNPILIKTNTLLQIYNILLNVQFTLNKFFSIPSVFVSY